MRIPEHHPSDERLAQYASGTLSEPFALVVASHLTLCPKCRAAVTSFEQAAGEWLAESEPAPLPDGSFERLMEKVSASSAPAPPHAPPTPPSALTDAERLPRPILDALDKHGTTHWKRVLPSLLDAPIGLEVNGVPSRLLRFGPGFTIPNHTHHGVELTLVLTGGLTECGIHYTRGDVAERTPDDEHALLVDRDQPCICLLAYDAGIKPLTLRGRIMAALTGY